MIRTDRRLSEILCLCLLLGVWGCSKPLPEHAPPSTSGVPQGEAADAEADKQPVAAGSPETEPGDPVVEALIEGLSDSDGAVRRQSAEGLQRRGARAAVPALVKRVADDLWIPKPRFRGTNNACDPEAGGKAAALEALKELAPDKVSEALRRAQKSKNAGVRAWAIQELKNL